MRMAPRGVLITKEEGSTSAKYSAQNGMTKKVAYCVSGSMFSECEIPIFEVT